MRRLLAPILALASATGCAPQSAAATEEALLFKRPMPDRADLPPILDGSDLEVVAELPYPPANVAVAPDGRTFFTFMAQGNRGDLQVAELVDGGYVPYPSAAVQSRLHTCQGIRVDRLNRLWFVDYGGHGYYRPKLYGVDLDTDAIVVEYTFPRDVAPVGSMLNDFQVSHDGDYVFFTDSSIIGGDPGLVVVDLRGASPTSFRRLTDHASVEAGDYAVHVDGERVLSYGLPSWFGADQIALDPAGEWLYFGALDAGELWRVRVRDLVNRSLWDIVLRTRVEKFADITVTDGITFDEAGHVYLTDLERSRIVRVHPDRSLDVLVEDPALRWPDGFSWGPDRKLYVTESALHLYLGALVVTDALIAEHAPYRIFRIDAALACADDEACHSTPGH